MDNRTLPNYEQIATNLYEIIVNHDVGFLVGRAEIKHALEQAQRVGQTLGEELYLRTLKEAL